MANLPNRKTGAVVRGLCLVDDGVSDEGSEHTLIAHEASGYEKLAVHGCTVARWPALP